MTCYRKTRLLAALLGFLFWTLAGHGQSDALRTAYDRAEALSEQGRYEEAVPLAEKAWQLREREFGAKDPRTVPLLFTLADVYVAQARYAEAEPLINRYLAILEGVVGADHPDVAFALNNLAGSIEPKAAMPRLSRYMSAPW